MITYLRTNSDDAGFRLLVNELDAYLAVINGTEDTFFRQFNKIDTIQHVVVAYTNDAPVGCGAIKEYAAGIMEVKRMFVLPEMRGQGIAAGVLNELESWAAELQYHTCILETAAVLQDAIRLYKRSRYHIIPNYGQYKDVPASVCFEKTLDESPQ